MTRLQRVGLILMLFAMFALLYGAALHPAPLRGVEIGLSIMLLVGMYLFGVADGPDEK